MLLFATALAGPVEVSNVAHRGVAFRVVTVDVNAAAITLVGQSDAALRTLDAAVTAVGPERRAVAATNAGMYHADRRPVGLHVERGTTHAPVVRGATGGNFGLRPNGVFFIDSTGAHIVATPDWKDGCDTTVLATQSGPLLVIDGAIHPRFRPESTSLKLRSGVGVRDDGTVALAISLEPVRFHDFATLFRDVLDCNDALFLDGSISSLWTEAGTVGPRRQRYSGVLVVSVPQRDDKQ